MFVDCLRLIDKVADAGRMSLVGAEDNGLLFLIEHRQQDAYTIRFTLLDLDADVEITLDVAPVLFDVAFQHNVIGNVDVFVQSAGNLREP